MKAPTPFRSGKRNLPWSIVIPARFSASGKRKPLYFSKLAEARKAAADFAHAADLAGAGGVALTQEALEDAQAARVLLKDSGLTLAEAARIALRAASGGSISSTVEGTGEAPAAAGPSLSSLLSTYDTAHTHQSARTRSARIGAIKTLFKRNPGLEDTPAATLSAADIQHCLDVAWPDADTAWNTAHKHLSAILGYAVKHALLAASVMGAIDTRHIQEQQISALTPDDLRRLLKNCRPALPGEIRHHGRSHAARMEHIDTSSCAIYIALGAFAGVRPEEIKRLKWADVDFEDSIITVRAQNSKTGGTRHIEMCATMRAWLQHAQPADFKPADLIVSPVDLTNKLKALRLRAGYSAKNPWQQDALRHSYATYYLKAGGNLHQLQLNMGHRGAHLLYTRYTNMAGVTRKSAADWWAILPKS